MSDKNDAEEQFHMQTGHKGCILFSTPSPILQKICHIYMIRKPLLVPLPMFWLRPTTLNITADTHISTDVNKYLSENILRQYGFDWTNNRGNFYVQRYNHLPSATPGFYFECGEKDRDKISWSDSKFC